MKCLVWKCCILTLALALLLVLGALAEGTIGLPLAAAVLEHLYLAQWLRAIL